MSQNDAGLSWGVWGRVEWGDEPGFSGIEFEASMGLVAVRNGAQKHGG